MRTRGAAAPRAHRFVALEQGYHGDTVGGDERVGRRAVHADRSRALRVDVLAAAAAGARAPSWTRASRPLEALLAREGDRVAAVVVEPLLQGAAGCARTPRGVPARGVRDLATRHGALLIADEVLTGFGRTGARFACEQARA